MELDKQQIINLLQNRGETAAVERARADPPDLIDTERHADHLTRLGLDATALSSQGGGPTDMFGSSRGLARAALTGNDPAGWTRTPTASACPAITSSCPGTAPWSALPVPRSRSTASRSSGAVAHRTSRRARSGDPSVRSPTSQQER
jgi:hypothetical protein